MSFINDLVKSVKQSRVKTVEIADQIMMSRFIYLIMRSANIADFVQRVFLWGQER